MIAQPDAGIRETRCEAIQVFMEAPVAISQWHSTQDRRSWGRSWNAAPVDELVDRCNDGIGAGDDLYAFFDFNNIVAPL
jgi:hypothetical protein